MKTRILTLVALAGLGGTALAQDGGARRPAGGGGLLAALDSDGDGKLSSNELDRAVAVLRSLDEDKDGTVSGPEMGIRPGGGGPGRRGPTAPPFDQWDANGDGKVSREEAPERAHERWNRMDRNGDGFIDQKEQEEVQAMFRRMRERGGPQTGGGRGARGEGIWKVLAEKYDRDKNGEITLEEYGRSEERFGQLDKNDDGKLTLADLTSGRRNAGAGNTVRGPEGPPKVGDEAPDFELPFATKDGKVAEGRNVRLSSFKGEKPVALIFGSYT